MRLFVYLLFGALLLAPSWAWAEPDPADTTRVTVRLFDQKQVNDVTLRVEAGTLALRLSTSGRPVMTLRKGATARLDVRSGEVRIQSGDRGLYASALHFEPSDGGQWSVDAAASGKRVYTGALHVVPDGPALQLVNAVPLPDYVASVVATEYGFDDAAGSKAMAVVARTYALRAAEKFDGDYDHVDHTASQVYRGVDAVTGVSKKAAHETRGQVLTYQGKLAEAVYFSSSGGHTANNEDVWDASETLPYLRGKPDPYDRASPHHRWTASIDRDALLRALSREHGFDVQGFVPGPTSGDGRRLYVDLLRPDGSKHRVQANAFRLQVNAGVRGDNLKSTWFDARRRGDAYVFEGRGFGHGVGLSQWGAHEMAQRGHSYREIIGFYYTGVRISRMDGSQLAPPAPPVASEKPAPDKQARSRRIGW